MATSDTLRRCAIAFTLSLGITLACNGPADEPGENEKPAQAGVVPHPSSLRLTPTPRPEGALSASLATPEEHARAPASPDSVVFKRGRIEFYDGDGRVRVALLDAAAELVALDDPSITPERRPGAAPLVVVPIGGLADWVARHTREPAARDVVVELGARVRTMEKSLRELPRELSALWIDTQTSEEERRRQLFARWDECEGGATQPEATRPAEVLEIRDPGVALAMYRAHAGDRARGSIERFVRDKLTQGGPHAYSETELAALNNTRRSQRPFAPYVAVGDVTDVGADVAAPASGPLGAAEGPRPPT